MSRRRRSICASDSDDLSARSRSSRAQLQREGATGHRGTLRKRRSAPRRDGTILTDETHRPTQVCAARFPGARDFTLTHREKQNDETRRQTRESYPRARRDRADREQADQLLRQPGAPAHGLCAVALGNEVPGARGQRLRGETRQELDSAFGQIRTYLDHQQAPKTRGVAIHVRGGEDPLFLPIGFEVPLETEIFVDDLPHIYPLSRAERHLPPLRHSGDDRTRREDLRDDARRHLGGDPHRAEGSAQADRPRVDARALSEPQTRTRAAAHPREDPDHRQPDEAPRPQPPDHRRQPGDGGADDRRPAARD